MSGVKNVHSSYGVDSTTGNNGNRQYKNSSLKEQLKKGNIFGVAEQYHKIPHNAQNFGAHIG